MGLENRDQQQNLERVRTQKAISAVRNRFMAEQLLDREAKLRALYPTVNFSNIVSNDFVVFDYDNFNIEDFWNRAKQEYPEHAGKIDELKNVLKTAKTIKENSSYSQIEGVEAAFGFDGNHTRRRLLTDILLNRISKDGKTIDGSINLGEEALAMEREIFDGRDEWMNDAITTGRNEMLEEIIGSILFNTLRMSANTQNQTS